MVSGRTSRAVRLNRLKKTLIKVTLKGSLPAGIQTSYSGGNLYKLTSNRQFYSDK
jgi:hypothetical protein